MSRWTRCVVLLTATWSMSGYGQEAAAPPANAAATSESPPLAGHSFHGEVFNEGPRQSAVLLEGMGNVTFPVTTARPEAQQFFNQGVAQLHGFWYFESERSFRQVALLDPDCAMAYWGMAMSNLGNEKRAKGFIAEAMSRREKASDRERRHVEALHAFLEAGDSKKQERAEAYLAALEKLLYDYPDDVETRALLALQVWQNRNAGIKIQSHLAVDALLDQVFAVNPMHPAHHYRIHLWDYERPENAVRSSALCGPALPGIAHMWHMPGHIYSRLKRYGDAAWQQEASARVDHAHMMRYRVLPDQIHNFAHNNEWLIRNLIHVGRVRDGVSLARNMLELPQHPKYNTPARGGCSASYGRARLLDVLTTYELWDELLALADTPYLEPTDVKPEQVKRLRYIGVARFHLGQLDAARQSLADLQGQLADRQAARNLSANAALEKAKGEGKEEKEVNRLVDDARRPFQDEIRELERAVAELSGWDAFAAKDYTGALERLRKADSIDPAALGRVQWLAGQTEEALQAAQKHVDGHRQEVQPLACQVDLLWQIGKRDEAQKAFEQLRSLAGASDLGSPILARLRPIADALGLPADWRLPQPLATDLGERPDLDVLGPFRWQPSAAPDWTLADADGQPHALKEYQGRTVVVIFYLGYGCLHCAEQLKTFGPLSQQFADEGISVVAISSDDQEGLKLSLRNYTGGTFPFPLVANPDLDIFREYRCFDDFEARPLHGTFLIDDDGRVVWQDISYEPFMDARFVLQEALRQRQLAAIPAP